MEIIGITISEGKPNYVIVYTEDGQEIEYNKRYLKQKIGTAKYFKYFRD